MSLQQVLQPQSAANGFGYHRTEKDVGPRLESKLQQGIANSNHLSIVGDKGGSHERLVYLTTCLIGHTVEVQVLDGSVFSGIFHATDAEKDFGIILKMARLIKGVYGGQKNISGGFVKQPLKTMIIPAIDLVQVIAKGVPVIRSASTSELQCEGSDILIDSCIAQSHNVNVGRELERWVPGDDEPECPELENIFDGQWNRGWDQFEVNETLFGVKSTFDEDLYTTKLEKGPQMKELEREALRIAKEIEGEEIHDLHMAEERGMQLQVNLDIDEETRFSSVFRSVDDSGYNDSEDLLLDTQNYVTFGSEDTTTAGQSFAETIWNSNDGAQASKCPPMGLVLSSGGCPFVVGGNTGSADYVRPFLSGQSSTRTSPVPNCRAHDIQFVEYTANKYSEGMTQEISRCPRRSDRNRKSLWFKGERSDTGGLCANAAAYAPSAISLRGQETTCLPNSLSEDSRFSKAPGTTQSASSHLQPSTSTSWISDCSGGLSASGPGLSPSSSMGSFSLEKSTLNPNAKEFKLNPSAKSFIPSQKPIRPASPVSDGSFYYPANTRCVTHMPGTPVNVVPTFTAHSPVIFNSQTALPPQPYFHPTGPQFGQQMAIGQPQQAFYMQTYTPEMMYKGRDF